VEDAHIATADKQAAPPQPVQRWWLPFWDPSRAKRLLKVVAWLVAVGLVVAVLEAAGIDVGGWFSNLWDTITGVGFGYLAAGWTLQTAQTCLTALAWYFILRAGFPGDPVLYKQVLAAYATGVALNGFLPANIGTPVTLLMFVAIIPRANLAGVLGATVVQKIFFTAASAFIYVYLFVSVPGSFDLKLGGLHGHPIRSALIAVGGTILIVVVVRALWPRLKGAWEKAKRGGAILARPRQYLIQVVLPSLAAWLAKLGVVAVFLAGYGIAVSFHTVMAVLAGNSIGSAVAVTPGGVGVNQATNVAALDDVTSAATANAYSLGQQLAITAWNIAFALVVVIWAFGWTGGKLLVQQSYAGARAEARERKAKQKAKPDPSS
jgi:uncharacterized membrane protein YbhN (UPF0104 family)